MMPTGFDVARLLGRGEDADTIVAAEESLPLVVQFVRAYVRDGGFVDGYPGADLAAVITTATARLVVNPAQLASESADGYQAVGSFNGFTLPELAVLHRYRRRAQ